ncbi:MAG: DUF1800 domain-containing protein [Acidobacteria bacterium]|nr:DUF1800 domain-containing protein [Acidobacteriota bacterium]
MARRSNRQIEHLLRRAGFGARPDELDFYGDLSIPDAVDTLVNFDQINTDIDSLIGQPGYVGYTTNGTFSPRTVIADARQRWLFRMVHSDRPLQEKMTLFWHNHFATGYTKLAGALGSAEGARYLAAKASEDPGGVRGQIEMLRDNALGNFRDILTNIARDTAMLFWLDGVTNTKTKPQENFGREIMELFTMGVGHYTEPDVYAAARVFSGWNVQRTGAGDALHYEFIYNAGQHETTAKTFSFPIYADGNPTIPARAAAGGMQDSLDLINALAGNPNTARYLATKLYRFFVSEFGAPDPSFVNAIASVYLQSGYDMKVVMREVLLSPQFWDPNNYFARYSWPVEFVVRALKDVGWTGFSVATALTPLSNMGQTLYEPPDVSGWRLGKAWFSTSAMLSRMNFAAQLATNQKFNIAARAKAAAAGQSPDTLLTFFQRELVTAPFDPGVVAELSTYLRSTGAWTGSDAQLQAKGSGLVHLLSGSSEYQFV